MRLVLPTGFLLGVAAIAGAQQPVPAGPEFQVNTFTTGNQGNYLERAVGICRDDDGDFVVVFSDDSRFNVFARRFDAAGTPQGAEFAVDTPATGYVQPAVACEPDGDFVVVWEGDDLRARQFQADGTPKGASFPIASSFKTLPDVQTDAAGNFVVVWIDYGLGPGPDPAMARRFASDGTPQGSAFVVNAGTAGSVYRAEVDVDADGSFVVAWNNQEGVWARRFDAAGAPLGSDLAVSSSAGSHDPTVSSAGAGGFVVAWATYQQPAARRFDASGSPLGDEFEVADTVFAPQNVSVTTRPDGGFVVVWDAIGDYVIPFDETEMFARSFDADGAPRGPLFRVNSHTADYQQYGRVASDPSGDFVVVWTSTYGQDGDQDGVFAQRFAAAPPGDVGVTGTKLVILDGGPGSGKAKVVYVTNDPGVAKGPAGDPTALSGAFEVRYTDAPSVAGSFVLPTPWQRNESGVAKYVNTLAPAGPGTIKVAVVKSGLVAKVRAKGLGDGPVFDVFTGPPSAAGGLTTILTLQNDIDGSTRRFCTRFAADDGAASITASSRRVPGGNCWLRAASRRRAPERRSPGNGHAAGAGASRATTPSRSIRRGARRAVPGRSPSCARVVCRRSPGRVLRA